ncbi:hypothetical protein AMS68_004640 [Peltaster fructicola]|uniref:RNA helicase n=1 Tax=Peltaster fructicola TaxID=286661 RepID=A0A6H0XWJ6_9PEZI|nr:hypothetical protein AMS68_004640 [Peltaster fructicola]
MRPTLSSSTAEVQRCVYCAFQARKFAIQIQRFRTSARQAALEKPLIRKLIPGRGRPGRSQRQARDRDGTPIRGHAPAAGVNAHMAASLGFLRLQYEDYPRALKRALEVMREELSNAPFMQAVAEERQESVEAVFKQEWRKFTMPFTTDFGAPRPTSGKDDAHRTRLNSIRADLKQTWERGKTKALKLRIKFLFCDSVLGARFSSENVRVQKALADIRYPSEWYPTTRQLQRVVHLHVGPTNSGKTYQALKRLEEAQETSVYAGPLRLLAHEVYSRMNAKGISTILITGDDKRFPEGHAVGDKVRVNACTVEMLSVNSTFEVCVVDEIQMLGDPDRGWAWTQAVFGVRARELHLCGEERAVPLIEQMCALTGEKLHIHRYERLSPLKMDEKALGGDLKRLQKGDCVISFSVMGIHALRKLIEKQTGKKVATVYGSLPPETRAQQAKLFNDPDNDYDYLVASDAVGMGLNLAIKRVVFETTIKFNGMRDVPLDVPSIKQIAGRAGRYRTAHQANQRAIADQNLDTSNDETTTVRPQGPSVGLVTTLEDIDFPVVQSALESQSPPITTAGIEPPVQIVERFATYFPPNTPLSFILSKLHELCTVGKRFHLCNNKDQLYLADLIDPIKNLTIADRFLICQAPTFRDPANVLDKLLPAFARIIADQADGRLTEIRELPLEVLDSDAKPTKAYLAQLETLHKSLVLYLWLAYRFAGVFSTRELAVHAKELTEAKIEQVLEDMSFDARNQIVHDRQQKQLVEQMAHAAVRENRDEHQDPADTVALVTELNVNDGQDESGESITLPEEVVLGDGEVDNAAEDLPDRLDFFEKTRSHSTQHEVRLMQGEVSIADVHIDQHLESGKMMML